MRWKVTGLVTVLAVLGCSSTPTEPETGWIPGVVVARDVAVPSGDPPSIHVRNDSEECGVVFLIRSSTVIRNGGYWSLGGANYSHLTVGTRVRVAADIVLDSCPGQSVADIIEIER